MKTDVKEKLVEALRSGEYKQGDGVLRSLDDRFCCLGVMCDVTGTRWRRNHRESDCYVMGVDNVAGLPSARKLSLCGLSEEDADTLTRMNDAGYSFDKIATYIEEYL